VTIDQGGNRGKFKTIGLPFSLSNYKRAPDLGKNNKEILASLGYDPDQIEKLTEEGVISKAQGPKNPRTEIIKGESLIYSHQKAVHFEQLFLFKIESVQLRQNLIMLS